MGQVLESMSRVDRILTTPGGSMLLAGRSGVGRRTAVSVMAHLHDISVVTPPVTPGYGIKNFRNDLKQVCVHYQDRIGLLIIAPVRYLLIY